MHKFAFVRLKTSEARDRLLTRLPEMLPKLIPFVPKFRSGIRLSDSVIFFSAQSHDFLKLGKGMIRNGAALTAFDGFCRLDSEPYGLGEILDRVISRTPLHEMTDAIVGEYALGRYDPGNDRFFCVSDFTGLRPLYYIDNQDFFAVSNRQMFLNPLCTRSLKPTIDIQAATSLLAKGNLMTDRSLLADVRMLKPGHAIISDNKKIFRIVPAGRNIGSSRGIPKDGDYRDAVDELLQNFEWLSRAPGLAGKPVTMSLTGGEDSRFVLALALNSALAPRIETFTYGLDDNPDIAAAEMVAKAAGVPHVKIIHKRETSSRDLGSIWRALRFHAFRFEGAPGGWDGGHGAAKRTKLDLTGIFAAYFKRVRQSSAELDLTSRDMALKHLHEAQQPHDPLGLVLPEAVREDDAYCRDWLDQTLAEGAELNDIPELFYSQFRLPWWGGGMASNVGSMVRICPLASKRSSEVSLKQTITDRRERRFIFEAMLRLRPDLLEIPYLNKQWPAHFQGRAPHVRLPGRPLDLPPSQNPSVPWQITLAKTGMSFLSGFIRDHGLEEIFDLVDRRRFEEIVGNPGMINNTPAVRSLVNLSELLILMADQQMQETDDLEEHNLQGDAWETNMDAMRHAWTHRRALATAVPPIRRTFTVDIPKVGVRNLRIDPLGAPGRVELHSIQLLYTGNRTLDVSLLDITANRETRLQGTSHGAIAVISSGTDPQLFLPPAVIEASLEGLQKLSIDVTAARDLGALEVFFDFGAGFTRAGMFQANY